MTSQQSPNGVSTHTAYAQLRPSLITRELQTSSNRRHGGGHNPGRDQGGNTSNPPSLSSSQPTYTQPSFQGTTQYGSSYASSSPQLSTGRHGGGHVPRGAPA